MRLFPSAFALAAVLIATAAAAEDRPCAPWSAPQASCTVFPDPQAADTLAAQTAANRAYHRELRDRLGAEGGCNADILPPWFAEACWMRDVPAVSFQYGSQGGE